MCVRAEPAQAHARKKLLGEVSIFVSLHNKADI